MREDGGEALPVPPSQSQPRSSQVDSGTRLPTTPSKKAKRKSDVFELGATAPPPSSKARVAVEEGVEENAGGGSGEEEGEGRPRLVGRVSSGTLEGAKGEVDSDATEALGAVESSLPEPDTQPDEPGRAGDEEDAGRPVGEEEEVRPLQLAPPTPTARSTSRSRAGRTDENQSPPGRHRLPRVGQSSSVKSDRTVRRAPLRERDVQTAKVRSPRALSPSPSPSPARLGSLPRPSQLPPSSSSSPAPAPPPPSQRRLALQDLPSDDDDGHDGEAGWRGVPFPSPTKRAPRSQRFMDEAPPTGLLAEAAGEELSEPGRATSPANEELRWLAGGAGPVVERGRESSAAALLAGGLSSSPRKKVSRSPLSSSPRKGKRVRGGDEGERQGESGTEEGEQQSSDRARVRANRRKRRKSGGKGAEERATVKEEEEEEEDGEEDAGHEEAKPPARKRRASAAVDQPQVPATAAGSATASARKPGKYDRPLKNSPAALKATASTPGARARRLELNPDRHGGETAAFKEVVRNKEGRKQMFASACDECEAVSSVWPGCRALGGLGLGLRLTGSFVDADPVSRAVGGAEAGGTVWAYAQAEGEGQQQQLPGRQARARAGPAAADQQAQGQHPA